jgi:hypothetical protein
MHAYLMLLRMVNRRVRSGEITRDEGRLVVDRWVNDWTDWLVREPVEPETY